MSMLYIIASLSLTSISLALNMCPESISTVSIVNRCPANATEWVSAAKRKSCNDLGQLQTCTNANDFVYHCVLNKDATLLLEVCAPTHLMSGYCARFSDVEKRIIIDTGLDCTKFDPPCSASFLSNESYKYQMCYRNAGVNLKCSGVSQEKNVHVTTASVIFAIIILFILIIIGVGYKLKMIKFVCRKICTEQTSPTDQSETERPPSPSTTKPQDQSETERPPSPSTTKPQDIPTEYENTPLLERGAGTKDTEKISNLTGNVTIPCSLEGLKTISALRDKLATKLEKPREILFLVDMTSGQIFADEAEIRKPLKLMIGNQNRMKDHIDDDEYDDNDGRANFMTDVISNKRILSKGNKMSCGHFTVADTLFDFTKDNLQGSLDAGIKCPVCKVNTWSIFELVIYCNMSEDEKKFFLRVANLNEHNKKLHEEVEGIDVQSIQLDSAETTSSESDISLPLTRRRNNRCNSM